MEAEQSLVWLLITNLEANCQLRITDHYLMQYYSTGGGVFICTLSGMRRHLKGTHTHKKLSICTGITEVK